MGILLTVQWEFFSFSVENKGVHTSLSRDRTECRRPPHRCQLRFWWQRIRFSHFPASGTTYTLQIPKLL